MAVISSSSPSGGVQRGHVFFVVFVALVLSAAVRVLIEIRRHHAQTHALNLASAATLCNTAGVSPLRSSIARQDGTHDDEISLDILTPEKEADAKKPSSPPPPPERYHDDYVAMRGAPWRLPASAIHMYDSSLDTWFDSRDRSSGGAGGGDITAGDERSVTIDPARFRLHIKVLAFDRVDSIRRCLQSLVAAHYDSEPVSLDIMVDHPYSNRTGRYPWTPRTAAAVKRMHALLSSLNGFSWPHGPMRVSARWENGGIQPQWVEAWWPESANDFAFVVEDDMEVSPFFYRYLKRLLAHYYFNATNFNPRAYGLSFQRQFFTTGIGGSPVSRQPGMPFLYELVGTWGQVLFPMPWRDFRLWYDLRRHNSSRRPILPGLKSNAWYLKTGERLWTPWIIKWAFAHTMFNLYPALPGNFSLSVSHRDKGTNIPISRGADAEILRQLSPSDGSLAWWEAPLPPTAALPRFDLCFHRLARLPPSRSLEEFHALLAEVHRDHHVSLVIVPPHGADLASNWACHVRGIAGLSYAVLLVDSEALANDLSARGHAVHVVKGSGESTGAATAAATAMAAVSQDDGSNVWQVAHVQLLVTALTLGYNVLLASADTVWRGDVLKAASKLLPEYYDMGGHVDSHDFTSSFFFVRSRPVTIAAWNRLAKKWQEAVAAADAEALQSAGSQGSHWVHGQQAGWLLGHGLNFFELKTLHPGPGEGSTDTKGSLPLLLPRASLSKREKIEEIKAMNVWIIDDHDFACNAVVCRRK